MKKLFLLLLLFFYLPSSVLAINPPAPDVKPLPPVIFVMNDWMNGDWDNRDYHFEWDDRYGHNVVTGRPEWGALGGWTYFKWKELNPQRGYYNWQKTDDYIRQAKAMRVTLSDGRVISKPVGIAIHTWDLNESPTKYGEDYTPSWVGSEEICNDPDGALGSCKPFCTPNFGNPAWQRAFDDFVLAMGQHYDNKPEFTNLAFINIATGVDGETAERKNIGNCQYFSANSDTFNKWVAHLMGIYNQAFPHTPQFLQDMLHGTYASSTLVFSFSPRSTGVKVNGWAIDHIGSEIRYDGVLVGGATGFSQVFYDRILTGYEPGISPGIKGSYWMFMEGLFTHPTLLDVQRPYIEYTYQAGQETGFPILEFARKHLGKTIENTPDVWTVLRETKHSDQCWKASDGIYKCYGPHHGDFESWLYRKDSLPKSRTVALLSDGSSQILELPEPARSHIYSWHSVRRTDQLTGNVLMSFDVDDRYETHRARPKNAGGESTLEITVTLLNKGNDYLSLEYKDYTGNLIKKRIQKGAFLGSINNWVDYTFTLEDAYFDNNLDGGIDFRINCENDGDEYLHRIIVKAISCPGVESGNLNNDCLIDEKDLTILLSQWQAEESNELLRVLTSSWGVQ